MCSQIKEEKESSLIDLHLSTIKLFGATWMIAAYEYLFSKPDTISNGFKKMKKILDVC